MTLTTYGVGRFFIHALINCATPPPVLEPHEDFNSKHTQIYPVPPPVLEPHEDFNSKHTQIYPVTPII